jgi:hypothetical protein
MKLEFCQQIFEKYSYIEFHKNPSRGSQDVPCGQPNGWTGMMKLTVSFHNFVNASKNVWDSCISHLDTVYMMVSSLTHWPLYPEGKGPST